jgi:hypothetical protein
MNELLQQILKKLESWYADWRVVHFDEPQFESFRAVGLNTPVLVQPGRTKLRGWSITNAMATNGYRYVKFYDAPAAMPVGTATPRLTLAVYSGQAAQLCLAHPVVFENGLVIAATQNASDSDTTLAAATDVICNIYFQ